MSSTSITSTSNLALDSLPTLPTELVEEILAQDSLSKFDLAQCCLVSRQFLHPARRSLYATITLRCISSSSYGNCRISRQTHLLYQTLRSSSVLAMSVRALVCKDEHAVGGTQLDQHASAFARDWLVMLPRVDQLSLNHWIFRQLWDYIVSEGPRWITLNIKNLNVGDVFRPNTPFTNLKKLTCLYSPSPDTKIMHLPPQLVHLDFNQLIRTSSPIENYASSALRFLRTNGSALSAFPDFSKLPHLQHLEITNYDDMEPFYSEVTQFISSCQSLVSLGLEVSFSEEIPDFRIAFARLPQTLLRLNFLSAAPFETIIDSVERGSLDSIRIIGLPDKYSKKDWAKEYLHILRWLCSSRGIAVEWIKGDSYGTDD